MVSRRMILAVSALGGAVLAAGAVAGCAALGGWLEARRARRPPFQVVSAPVADEIVRDSPDVFILDLRSPEEFQGPKGHVRNALNIPLARLPYRLLELRAYRGETFLVYCSGDDCGRAGIRILTDSGFPDAILIAGGIDGWLRSGFTTFVRASVRQPPTAEIQTRRHPELMPAGAPKPMDELPVVPPKEPAQAPARPPPVPPQPDATPAAVPPPA